MISEPSNMSRRDFNAASLMLTAGAMLGAPAAASAAFSRKTTGDLLKVGIVGCGGRGTGALVQALLADPDSVLWSMGDLYEERLAPCLDYATNTIADESDDPERAIKHKIQIAPDRMHHGFDAYKRVIDSGVDVVILTTPPGFRPEHLDYAVRKNKHIFCEKPVAVDGPGVRTVLDAASRAKAAGLSIMSGFCWRYQDQVAETFNHVRNGGVGEVRAIQTTYNTTGWVQPKPRKDAWTDAEFMTRNWHYFHPLSGDHIVEQAVHAIDWQCWVMGDELPESCFAVGGRMTRPDKPETGNVYDNFGVTYEYANGVRGYHMCRHWPNSWGDNTARVLGSDGVCTMMPWRQQHTIEGAKPWSGAAPANDMYQREHDILFKSIRDAKPVNDGIAMARSTLVGIMGRMAAYTGKVVTADQAINSSENLNAEPWMFGQREFPTLAIPGKTELR